MKCNELNRQTYCDKTAFETFSLLFFLWQWKQDSTGPLLPGGGGGGDLQGWD